MCVERNEPSQTAATERLEENIGAVSIELTPSDLREIEDAASRIIVQGERYPESAQKTIAEFRPLSL
jgi:diketogulonate reductase-like aldo/keto reductase